MRLEVKAEDVEEDHSGDSVRLGESGSESEAGREERRARHRGKG